VAREGVAVEANRCACADPGEVPIGADRESLRRAQCCRKSANPVTFCDSCLPEMRQMISARALLASSVAGA